MWIFDVDYQYTKDLVHSDRISLFLIDKEKKELYVDIFDEGVKDPLGKAMFKRSAKIRVPLTMGIAGFVARTGQIVNIPEAYKDPRFNRAVDIATGYTTKSILSMPIITHGQVIGVVQMINKISPDGVFTLADEHAFKMFAVYCSMSLRYAQ
ncbi:cAMP and cAMP-inhibited cGMP 3',5'-cyclic phosphodiesterase 10A, partial [Lamellibrachia satsuma]